MTDCGCVQQESEAKGYQWRLFARSIPCTEEILSEAKGNRRRLVINGKVVGVGEDEGKERERNAALGF